MITKKEVIERVKTTLRRYNVDRFVPNRFILHILEEKMTFLLSQKLRDRSLYRESNLYTVIECFEFKEVDYISCGIHEFKRCKSIMKSIKPLPQTIFSRYGSGIRYLGSLDYSTQITETTPKELARNSARRGYKEKPYFYIDSENYVYLLNTNMEAGVVELITLKTESKDKSSCDCKEKCKSILDYPFVGSDKLREIVVQETISELINSYVQIQPDENPDNNENSI